MTSGAVIELNYWKANAVNATNYTKAESDGLLATKANSDNKSTSVTTDQASNIKFPSVKSVYDWAVGLFATIANLNLKAPLASPTFTGVVTLPTGIANKIPKYTSNGVLGDSLITELNGKLGVNTNSPNGNLAVVGSSGGGGVSSNVYNLSPSGYSAIRFSQDGTSAIGGTIHYFNNAWSSSSPAYSADTFNFTAYGSGGYSFVAMSSAPIVFYSGGLSSGNERLRIEANGNIGVSNSNPSQKLDVNGNIKLSGILILGQYTTATRPAYVKGSQFFDTTINKMVIGGATAWEEVTSS